MYTSFYGKYAEEFERNMKKGGIIFEVLNNRGVISVVEKDYFISKDDASFKDFIFVKKEKNSLNKIKKYEGFTEDTFCENLNLSINQYFYTGFRHFNKEILKKEWNKKVDTFKISKNLPTYLCNIHFNDFSEFLKFVKQNISYKFDKISIKAKDDDILIDIYIEDEMDFKKIEFYLEKDDAPSLKDYAEEWVWDEGIEGTIFLEKFNEYFRTYGGIDLTKTYLSYFEMKVEDELKELKDFFCGDMYKTTEHYLLPLFKYISGKYLYELIDRNIFVHEIITEDEENWYTTVGKFKKNNLKDISQFNPVDFCDMYTDDIEELIKIYNNNLEKFYL